MPNERSWHGLEFEWDPQKAEAVERDHRVSFHEAITVFWDPFAATVFDETHSRDEDRFVTIGATAAGRMVVVAHTPRGRRIRLVTARLATPAEIRAYEKA